ncbi:hypothetical protein PSN45_004509 [Yamadazyma tenuis]|uniref:ER membrane protein complex subunit 1 n=1 Tax=Candida tenuis (strain ATCC 10573 / BCRC 21748 / CBS 615 / JCM 9827 / NBRC 10315 / NRRL Y-1498 / VKM Y-70) TaxID=590646 RepID=G3B5G2_CANTC|nr:DUF1620-domain-containing protein [Yamadazyma tenuis ATCC 10573]EGV63215.1 DUF1620-domain-containing protein [Yamadazyma tenuis ATCC 10573]WEJ96963.1 hypothetical protein PSN45_004509 [Yamadazyma tenuis]
MVRLTQFLGFVVLIATCVSGVFLEDAFTKNWVKYNHALIKSFDAIQDSSFVGVTLDGELVKYNLTNEAVLSWKVTVPLNDVEYLINGGTILTYSTSEDTIYLWDIQSGVLLNNYQVGPVKYISRSFGGFIVLSSNSLLTFVDGNLSKEIATSVGDIWASEFNGLTYIVTDDSKLLKLDPNFKYTTVDINVKFSKISQIVGNRVLVNGQVFDLDKNQITTKAKVTGLFESEPAYSLEKNKFKIIKDDKVVLEDDFEESSVKVLQNYLLVDSEDERKVIDLKGFFESLDETSINLESYNHSITGKDYIFGNEIVSLIVTGKFIQFSRYNILLDKVAHYNYHINTYNLNFPKALLINKPESKQTMDSIQHLVDEIQQNNVLSRFIKRTRRHLVEFGKSIISKVTRLDFNSDHIEITNPYDLEKLLVFVDDSKLVAVDSLNGDGVWETVIEDGLLDLEENGDTMSLVYGDKAITVSTRDGEIIDSHDRTSSVDLPQGTIYVKQVENSIQSYKYVDGKLIPTWKFAKDKIINFAIKPNTKTGSVGIALHDKSVLYKYLNDNSIAVIAEEDGILKLYLIDGKSGNVIYVQEHLKSDNIDTKSIKLILDDNWIIYSYFVTEPKYEQRISVVDLFGEAPTKGNFTVPISSSSSKSFIYPERIIDLKSTYTRFGITLKSIIALTEDGDLVELPKYILNSRRIDDRQLSQNDFKDDFRMLPYEPVVARNDYSVLNHGYKLDTGSNNLILLKDTKLESTSIICMINSRNMFCTRVQPSLSFDNLTEAFQKFRLIITIFVLFVAYFVTKPMVIKKNLNSQWIYKA